MTKLKVVFSIDPTGFSSDIIEHIFISNDICLYCLHDKDNRFLNEVKKAIEYKGYDLTSYFELMKVYTLNQ